MNKLNEFRNWGNNSKSRGFCFYLISITFFLSLAAIIIVIGGACNNNITQVVGIFLSGLSPLAIIMWKNNVSLWNLLWLLIGMLGFFVIIYKLAKREQEQKENKNE